MDNVAFFDSLPFHVSFSVHLQIPDIFNLRLYAILYWIKLQRLNAIKWRTDGKSRKERRGCYKRFSRNMKTRNNNQQTNPNYATKWTIHGDVGFRNLTRQYRHYQRCSCVFIVNKMSCKTEFKCSFMKEEEKWWHGKRW